MASLTVPVELGITKKIVPAAEREGGNVRVIEGSSGRERRVGIESLTRRRLFGVPWNVSLDARSNWLINPPASHYYT
jgi:hypothetical protein